MENKCISIQLIGLNEYNTAALYNILDTSDNFSIICLDQPGLEYSIPTGTDCIIVDFKIWSKDTFHIVDSGLKKNNPDVPLIFTGDQSDDAVIADSFSRGADDYLSYPFKKNEVISRIKNQIYLRKAKSKIEEEVEKRTSDLKNSNALLNDYLEEYKLILKDLQENETLLLTIALNIPNSYLSIVEKNYTIGFAAGQEFKKSNIDPWRLVGLPVEKVFKDHAEFVKNHFMKAFAGSETSFELKLKNQDLLYNVVPLFNSTEEVSRILVVAENITQRKTSEIRIKESLHEKETLLKEIHHRVKNNMQLVCSMMNLQAEYIDDSDVFNIFRVLQSRIYSMSLVHEKLYRHKQFSKINFKEYVKDLVSEISNSFLHNFGDNNIKIELILDDEYFTIDKAIPCGLILNELILNAFKHALLSTDEGYIKIIFEKSDNGCFRLSVSDNGKGLPDGFDINETDTMGMTLVRELVTQIKGKVSVSNGINTTFTIIFGETPLKENYDVSVQSGNGKKNILLVEDERIISRMLRKIIEERGYNIVDSVSSGRDAISSAARFNPDLIIMDIMLEDDINGIEAASVILKNHDCPIIFLTGNSDPATLKSAKDINPYDMLTKPVEKFQLMDVIESALN